ncbi:MAG: glycosyltransferase family 39 protein [Flavobacteriales bacterium]|nr:glycosyltransferase family 39 protein [Flavobacteriales bacterium]
MRNTPTTIPGSVGTAWLALAIIAQLIWTIWCARLSICADPSLALGYISLQGGDHFSYIGAMESVITHGEYSFINFRGEKVLAGRLPHYAAPYYVLRSFMGAAWASDAMVVLQAIMLGIAIWLLARAARRCTGSHTAGLVALLCLSACPYAAPYACKLLPDAFAMALLTIAWYLLDMTLRERSRGTRALLGLALAALVVLKPYFAILYAIVPIIWLFNRWNLRTIAKRTIALGVPVLVLLSPWWIRNALVLHRFFPFQQDLVAGYGYRPAELRMRDLLALMGDDATTFWSPGTMACLMQKDPPLPCTCEWPAHLSANEKKGLDRLRADHHSYQVGGITDEKMVAEIDRTILAYRQEYPFRAHALNRLLRVKRFLVNSGSYHLPVHRTNPCFTLPQMVPKLAASVGYWLSLTGLVMALFVGFTGDRSLWVWCVPAGYLLILFPLALGWIEWRYFSSVFLIDLWLFVVVLERTWTRLQHGRATP